MLEASKKAATKFGTDKDLGRTNTICNKKLDDLKSYVKISIEIEFGG